MPTSKPADSVVKRKNKKSIACRRCHTHKIKCSGGQPCSKCRGMGLAAGWSSYLDQLAAENEKLREQLSQSPGFPGVDSPVRTQAEDIHDAHVQNPMLSERGWFQPYDHSAPPVHIGEAACTAFATRLRQVLTQSKATSHMPRTQYTPEATLYKIRDPDLEWPGLPQARLLVQIVINQVSRVYHLFLRKATIQELEDVYARGHFDDPVLKMKFFALFALGEVYSARSHSSLEGGIPGAKFYVNAMTLIPILPERPSLTHVEALLLLSLYCYFLNRRHSAFLLVGDAMRLGLTLGLNHDIPECNCPDPIVRQHRIRLWWAIYVYDRMYGSKTGWPIQIADDDIHVEMPSEVPSDPNLEQFSDTQFLVASIQLARITGQAIEKIYSRKRQPDSFLQREQKLLIALKEWSQALPSHLRLNRDGYVPKHVASLHLQFNQCIMLATRPILLYTLIQSRNQEIPDGGSANPNEQTLKTLGDACIHAARHTHSLIVEEWTNGSLPIYGYFYAHYLFSCALIMVISSQIYAENQTDFALFETGYEILRAMRDHGNLAATEFYDNLECVRQSLDSPNRPSIPNTSLTDPVPADAPSFLPGPRLSEAGLDLPETAASGTLADEMVFLDQSMEDFLAQPDVDFGPLDPSGVPVGVADAVYSWPNFSLWTA
ncbi:hypothetical protein N7532_002302 [Penicillium argentinense]|uniref:Xylanolytic transcriptional activator regulatory domain-containing protein n=1 Tax=Penicillium argentinense TaxID=1131581 RepID=A0A9W9G1Q1_9EURO|nr:uncharacterized protein N7532_002302 [Penicillium argentinense]KAJ5109657.1 hypothetical protein N7532_002302 [Penicillium argentinense]